jgi:hypothetical protein
MIQNKNREEDDNDSDEKKRATRAPVKRLTRKKGDVDRERERGVYRTR